MQRASLLRGEITGILVIRLPGILILGYFLIGYGIVIMKRSNLCQEFDHHQIAISGSFVLFMHTVFVDYLVHWC